MRWIAGLVFIILVAVGVTGWVLWRYPSELYGKWMRGEGWNKYYEIENFRPLLMRPVALEPIPEYKEEYLVESSFNYPVSFNGKTRFFQEYDRSLSKEEVEKEIMTLEQTRKYLEGKTPKKVIVVPNKIVNIVV